MDSLQSLCFTSSTPTYSTLEILCLDSLGGYMCCGTWWIGKCPRGCNEVGQWSECGSLASPTNLKKQQKARSAPMEFVAAFIDGSVWVWRVSAGEGVGVFVRQLWGPNFRILCAADMILGDVAGLSPNNKKVPTQSYCFFVLVWMLWYRRWRRRRLRERTLPGCCATGSWDIALSRK